MIENTADSFTYNLVQYLGELGASPEVIRNDTATIAEVAAMSPLGIVISPGPCTPAEAGICTDLVRELGPETPILGVCLGHQCIGEAYGGRVVRAPKVMHGKLSQVQHDGKGVFAAVTRPLTTSAIAIARRRGGDPPGAILRGDGSGRRGAGRVLMGVRHRELPVEGVQFGALESHPHPECTRFLLRNFVDLCRNRAAVPA